MAMPPANRQMPEYTTAVDGVPIAMLALHNGVARD
jgi:hypothetical protein